MKKQLKKTLSLILSLMMIMSMFSGIDVISLADSDNSDYLLYETENEKSVIADGDEPGSEEFFVPETTTIVAETTTYPATTYPATTYPDITEDYYPEESTTQPPSEPSIRLGDVTDDGKIDSSDARVALRAVVGLDVLSETAFYAADVDEDGAVTSNDVRLILRVAAKLDKYFGNDYTTTPSTPLITMYYTEDEDNPQEITVHVFASYFYDTCSGDIRFAFDSSVMEFISMSFNDDNVSMGMCNSTGNEILASFLFMKRAKTDLEIFTITFNRLTDDETDITFEPINWFGTYAPEAVSLNLNTPGNAPAVPEIPTQAPPTTEPPTTEPSEPVTPIEKKGDINFDDKITAADARAALRAVVGLYELSETAFYNADVDEDGAVTSNDARLILRVSAKLTLGFNNDYTTTPSTPVITMNYTENEENPQEITVHVYANNFYDTCSCDVRFAFDSSVLEFSSLTFNSDINSFNVQNSTGNEILASFLFLDRAKTDSEIFTITFNRLTDDETVITFESINWFGTYAPENAYLTINEPTSYDPALRYLEYSVYDDGVWITGCDEAASGELVIPETIEGYPVTTINSYAFYGCDNITSITIPSGVNSMSYGPFEYCTGLERIIVDENNEYYSSDENGVLFNKDKTVLIQYPAANENAEYTIPESTIKIDDYAFKNCSNLEILRIHENVSEIGYEALYNCTKLTDIYFGGSIATWGKISRSAYLDESVIVHTAKEAELVEFFDYYISDNQVTLTDCADTISGDITIPETIDGYPVTRFENGLFYDCANLTGITIPASVTEIDENVFTNCPSLAYIAVDKNNEYYVTDENGVLFNKDMTEIIRYPAANSNTEYTIPDSVVKIGFLSFSACWNLESVIIGKNVKKINSEAFAGCSALKNVSIPESVTIIEDSAFEYCLSLKSITMPGFVSYIGCYAMGFKYVCESSGGGASCYYKADEDFVIYGIPNSASERYAKECGIRFESIDGYTDNKPSDEKYLVVSDTCGANLTWSLYSDGELIINGSGDDFKGHRPTLDPTWWYYRKDIVTVRIEHGITGIYSYSFRECSNLKEIYIPSTIEYISYDAFWECDNIDTIYYEGSEAEWDEISKEYSFLRYTNIIFNYEMPPMEEPSVEEPPVEEPPVEEPPVEEPPVEEPPVEDPPVEEPPVEEPPVEEPPVEEPPVEEPPVEDPPVEEPPVEDPPVEEPPVEEPPVEEPPVEEPPVEDPPVEEPPVEEPPVEEPPVEEPPVEEPADNGQLEVKGDGGITIDFENKISQIAKEQTVENLSEMIENENFAIVDKNGNAISDNAFVGTGSKILILDKDGNIANEYTVVVPTDIDGNGKTTAADARLALRTSAQLESLDGVYSDAADVTGDGKITASDARKILRISAGLEK